MRVWEDCPSCDGGGIVYSVRDDNGNCIPMDPSPLGDTEPCPTCKAHFKAMDAALGRIKKAVHDLPNSEFHDIISVMKELRRIVDD